LLHFIGSNSRVMTENVARRQRFLAARFAYPSGAQATRRGTIGDHRSLVLGECGVTFGRPPRPSGRTRRKGSMNAQNYGPSDDLQASTEAAAGDTITRPPPVALTTDVALFLDVDGTLLDIAEG